MISSNLHPALQAAYDAIDQAEGDSSHDLVRAKCRALMFGYHERWKDSEYETLDVEVLREASLINPATFASSRTFTIAGKVDVVASRHGKTVLIDHKTTSQDITDPNGAYWRQLVIEGQVSHYMWLEWLNGRKIDEAVWDVVRKPQISPKKLSKHDRLSVVSERKYFSRPMSQATLEALQTDERETVEMYEARLAYDCTETRPDWYFARRAVPRMDRELMEYSAELWEHSQSIMHVRRRTTAEQLPPRNSGACMLYGSPCKFLGICSDHDSPDSDKWQHKQQVHIELPDLGGDGRDVLTNSRIRCFQTCPRRHYYEFELGIQRIDEEEKEALYFGTLFHSALAAFWNCFRIQEELDHGSATGQPVIGIGTAGTSSQPQLAR